MFWSRFVCKALNTTSAVNGKIVSAAQAHRHTSIHLVVEAQSQRRGAARGRQLRPWCSIVWMVGCGLDAWLIDRRSTSVAPVAPYRIRKEHDVQDGRTNAKHQQGRPYVFFRVTERFLPVASVVTHSGSPRPVFGREHMCFDSGPRRIHCLQLTCLARHLTDVQITHSPPAVDELPESVGCGRAPRAVVIHDGAVSVQH